jgi:hypothetical protein
MIKFNNTISVIFGLVFSSILVFFSFSGNSEAYLFPKIISSSMLLLAILSLIYFFVEKKENLTELNIKKLYPYLVSILIFVLLGQNFGFYLLLTVLFVVNCFVYSKKRNFRTSIEILITTSIFVPLIYLLFSVLLKVQVPRFYMDLNIF